MIMTWETEVGRYSCGEHLRLGRWIVGSADYDSSRPKGSAEMWAAMCHLPGVKRLLGHYATIDEARAKVEGAVEYWMAKATEGAQ